MIGCAISSSTSGGTETGPGVNRYFFDGVTTISQSDAGSGIARRGPAKKSLVSAGADRQTPNAKPRFRARDLPSPRPLYVDNEAFPESQVCPSTAQNVSAQQPARCKPARRMI